MCVCVSVSMHVYSSIFLVLHFQSEQMDEIKNFETDKLKPVLEDLEDSGVGGTKFLYFSPNMLMTLLLDQVSHRGLFLLYMFSHFD